MPGPGSTSMATPATIRTVPATVTAIFRRTRTVARRLGGGSGSVSVSARRVAVAVTSPPGVVRPSPCGTTRGVPKDPDLTPMWRAPHRPGPLAFRQ